MTSESNHPQQRFVLDKNGIDVIDRLNPTGPKGHYYEGYGGPKDQTHLREYVLWGRLCGPVGDLIINLHPEETSPDGTKYRPYNEEQFSIFRAIYGVICSSRLNTIDPSVSIQNRLDGALKRQKTSLQEVTSLSLFRDDIERLLRDLYGDIDSDALDDVLRAIFLVVEEFTRYLRKDLYCEHQNAMDWDYIWGIGVPNGHGTNGSDHRTAHKALDDLKARVRQVRKDPSAFSKYTVEFAALRFEEFINFKG